MLMKVQVSLESFESTPFKGISWPYNVLVAPISWTAKRIILKKKSETWLLKA
jgi:hypothetical protein